MVAVGQVWIAEVLQIRDPTGFLIEDGEARTALLDLYPPTIVAVLAVAGAATALFVWPGLLVARLRGSRAADVPGLRLAGFSLAVLVVTSCAWSLIVRAILRPPRHTVTVWGSLILFALPPLSAGLALLRAPGTVSGNSGPLTPSR